MPRVFGVDIPGRKRIAYALCYIYGIGRSTAHSIISRCQIDPATKADDLSDADIQKITHLLQSDFRTEGDLRREVSQNIRRLISINCYRGVRHRKNLPVRGQRTRTNARTRKGPRRTVGAVRGKEARAAAAAPAK